MEIKSVSPNFTAHIKTDRAQRYLNRLPYDKSMEVVVMEMDNKHKKINVCVDTIVKNGKERLKAEVGYKTFVENFFRDAVKTLRKATKFANELEEEQNLQAELTKGMVPPTLG